MTDASNRVGSHRESTLLANLDELRGLTNELREELPHVNDTHLHPTITTLVDTADVVFAAHANDPKPTIADDLSVLMSAARALRIPLRDPDLDARTPTLERLRTSKGLIVAGLADALESAAALGLHPQDPPIPAEDAAALPRSEMEGLLQGILRRLTQVEKSLDALDEAKSSPTNFAQQTGLLDFYASSMRVEIDLARLHLSISENAVDFNALARAVETMARLTRDFVSTLSAWGNRVAKQVKDIAAEVPQRVRKVTTGVKASAYWIIRSIRRRNSKRSSEVRMTDRVPPDADRLYEMILAGRKLPQEWTADIDHIDLSDEQLSDLTSLASLIGLRKLSLDRTRVSNLTPLASLASLQDLSLDRTSVSDLAPLAGLVNLRQLSLAHTSVSDLTPLAGLGNLESLSLERTSVSDLAPLAGLARLRYLSLARTQVTDLAPLANARNLKRLDLLKTSVRDIAPIAGCSGLSWLNLEGTQVRNLAPIAKLTRLTALGLEETLVDDIAPLEGLSSLRELHLRGTPVRDVGPLSRMNLQHLDLQKTQVRDLAPVAKIPYVIWPDGTGQGQVRRRHRLSFRSQIDKTK